MSFSLSRSQMLNLLADAMTVPEKRRSAFLGRFQHLQRLSLIGGINPGRGKAAEYQAHQVLVIAIAFQMLQLGLTPERAVKVIKLNQDRVRLAISLAVSGEKPISPSVLWFDPSILTESLEHAGYDDLAEATFDYGGAGTGREAFERFFVKGTVQRMTFISVSGTIWHLAFVLDMVKVDWEKPEIKERAAQFLGSLREWVANSTPGSLD